MAGVFGSAFATLGVCLPSFMIIYIISLFFDAFISLTAVAAAFKGIQACVVYLILSAKAAPTPIIDGRLEEVYQQLRQWGKENYGDGNYKVYAIPSRYVSEYKEDGGVIGGISVKPKGKRYLPKNLFKSSPNSSVAHVVCGDTTFVFVSAK